MISFLKLNFTKIMLSLALFLFILPGFETICVDFEFGGYCNPIVIPFGGAFFLTKVVGQKLSYLIAQKWFIRDFLYFLVTSYFFSCVIVFVVQRIKAGKKFNLSL